MYDFSLEWGKKRIAVGKDHKILVNQLIGSNGSIGYEESIIKINMWDFEKNTPDIITDVSIGESELWKHILEKEKYIACTVPIYAFCSEEYIDENVLIRSIENQLSEGVRIITIHCTPTRELVSMSKSRIVPCTSRGGSIVIQDMMRNKKDSNIYLSCLDEIINICSKYNAAISIGTSFRPANVIDSLDDTQLTELKIQEDLAQYIWGKGVNVILEMPGHMSPQKIASLNDILKDNLFPIMPLGPVVTDIGAGKDHITSAIGLTLLGMKGNVQIISAMTREEHTGNIPSIESTKEAVEVAHMVAHIIEMDRFNDYSEDLAIAYSRKYSCVSNSSVNCNRCGDVCPLNMYKHP